MHGWTGTYARVDLTAGHVQLSDSRDLAARFVGGRGWAAKAYWDAVHPSADALSPENLLLIMAGPLTGTPAIACSRLIVAGKSPLLYPDQYGLASIGGAIGSALKCAGFDGLILSGKASRQSFIVVRDGAVSIEDASSFRGRDTAETLSGIRRAYGKDAQALCIGPAGERCVRFALTVSSGGSTAGHGFGAVFGAKNIKAVIVRGSGRVAVARPDRLKDLNRHIRSMVKGRILMDPMIEGIELVRRVPCKGCPAGCPRGIYRHNSGIEEYRKNCASAYFYSDWDKVYHGGESSGESFLATSDCDRLGLCTQEFNKLLRWLHRAHSGGVVSQEHTGLAVENIGSREFFQSLAESIVERKGFGDILAEGTIRAAHSLGRGGIALLDGIVEGSGFSADLYNGRLFITNALFHATDPTSPMSQLHEVCYPLFKWVLWYASDGGMSPVDTSTLRAIAKRFWRREDAVDFSQYEGKGDVARIIQNRSYAKETLVACDFFYPVITPEGVEDHIGDPGIESRLLSAVTGCDYDEGGYLELGERVYNLTRAIQVREGHAGRKADRLPEFNFIEPFDIDTIYFGIFNPESILPGPDGELISRKGAVIDRDKFEKMLNEFYRARGWDEASGLQKAETLRRVGIPEVIPELSRKEGLAQ